MKFLEIVSECGTTTRVVNISIIFFIGYLISSNLGPDERCLEEESKNASFEKKNCFLRDMLDKELENNKFHQFIISCSQSRS